MAKHWRKFIPLILLQPLVPWWFSGYTAAGFWGIPSWALYSILATVVYAAVMAWMLGRYWDEQAEADEASEPKGAVAPTKSEEEA